MKITEREVSRSKLIGRITQSAEWPEHETVKGLSLSSFDEQDGDEHEEAWVDVSWYSFTCLLDVFSCMACGVEAFTDLYFIVLQLSRPQGSGITTGWCAVGITIFSTLMFLAPPGKGGLSMFVKSDKWPYEKGVAKYRMRIASAVHDGYDQGTDVHGGGGQEQQQQPWGGLDVLNRSMQRASRFELYAVFPFVNMFSHNQSPPQLDFQECL